MDIMLASSKAGHDKGNVYVIVGEIDDAFFIANGQTRLLSKPKKKKKIHLQLIKNITPEVKTIIDSLQELDDLSIKRILKVYNRRNEDV